MGLKGEIIRCVPEDEVTYHVSKIDANFETISVFCCFERGYVINDNTYASLCELLRDICKRYNLNSSVDIVRHYDIDGNRCPVCFVDNSLYFERLKEDVSKIQEPVKTRYNAGKYIINCENGLDTRSSPNVNAEKIKSYLNNTIVPIFEISDEWGRTNGGWIPMKSVIPMYRELKDDYRITALIGLNCRQMPDINSQKITTYPYNTIVTIYEVDEKWGKTKDGWVSMDYIVPVKTIGDYYEINATLGLNIRKEPNITSNVIGEYRYNTIITVYEISNGWGRTNDGWVSMEYLKVA